VLQPDVYTGWDAESLGKVLAARKVPTSMMNRTDADGEKRHLTGFDEAGLRVGLETAGRPSATPDEGPE
jgi:hypothetical protein